MGESGPSGTLPAMTIKLWIEGSVQLVVSSTGGDGGARSVREYLEVIAGGLRNGSDVDTAPTSHE